MRIDFVRISTDAITPTQGSPGADGYDLHSIEEVIVRPNSARLIRTDIGFKIPPSYFGKIHSKSSFALKLSSVGGGIIEADHRGPVGVIIFNFSDKFLQI